MLGKCQKENITVYRKYILASNLVSEAPVRQMHNLIVCIWKNNSKQYIPTWSIAASLYLRTKFSLVQAYNMFFLPNNHNCG